MPTVPEYQAFKEASPDVQKNMTFYYNASASLRTWSAVSDEGSAALSGVFGEIFEEGQSKGLRWILFKVRAITCKNYLLKIYSQHGNFLNAI